jgi:hypothetical protein
MTSHYEPIAAPRFGVEATSDGEQIRIRPRRQLAAMIFLPIWLVVWGVGGAVAVLSIPGDISPYTAVWIGFWALGLVAAAASYAWMLVGSETIRVTGGDLEVTHAGLGLSRRWLYQGAEIRHLQVSVRPAAVSRLGGTVPFTRMDRTGSVKFDYGARTIYLAPGLEDAEGAMIVDRLATQLPASARA